MKIKGIAASSGYAIGKVFKLKHNELSITKNNNVDIEHELELLDKALNDTVKQLEGIRDKARVSLGEDKAQIFEAHILVASDPEMMGQVKNMVTSQKINADYALNEVANSFISIFESMDNEYMRERAADIKDVTKRILFNYSNMEIQDLGLIDEEVVIVAHDLVPSDTAQLNKQFVLGFATNVGGRTSHSAIMARSMEIPAVVGTKTLYDTVQDQDLIIVNGITGEIIINPTEEVVKEYRLTQENYMKELEQLKQFKDQPTVTLDHQHIELAANIGTPNDLDGVIENGAEGIGLYRTEFLYMGRDSLPNEEEQFKAYKTVLERMNNKPVVVRTLDIGGDKNLSYLEIPKEENPFLGFRAIRLCLDQLGIFKTQLRALLRASVYGNLKIMFPMIATVNEFIQAKSFLLEVKEELIAEGIAVNENIEIGMMVEIPAAAILADQFAKHVDFMSIGTNDLIQYTMAADRMNEQVSYLYQPYNPSLLRLIKYVIDSAHKEGKWVGMCGEMAGDQNAFVLLLGLGLDEFSMSASSVLKIRSLAAQTSKEQAQEIANKAINLSTQEEVMALVQESVK